MSFKRKKETSSNLKKKKSFARNTNENSMASGDGIITKENPSKFTDILNKRWKVFRVSPLHNFSHDKLKYHEKVLNYEMNSKRKLPSNIGYKSYFTINNNLKLNDQCVDALQVKVMKDETKTAYIGHFISWNNTTSDVEGSVCLPILLVEVKSKEVHLVHSAFCRVFDCDIQTVSFSLYALISFFVKLLETPRKNIDVSKEQVTMEYGFLEHNKNDKIKISLSLDATIVIFAFVMDNLRENFPEITSMEIIWEFYNKILIHIYKIFNLDLMLAELKKVVFRDATLTDDGQLKISTDDAAISALNVLQHFIPLEAVTSN